MKHFPWIIAIVLLISWCNTTPPQQTTHLCVIVQSLPDHRCTPGATFAVVTKEIVCTPGYAGKVRNVPQSVKDKVYAEYGIATHLANSYEVDHLISLELGGSNDIKNLWPETYSGPHNAHNKDKVENTLHTKVCSGTLSLQTAQQEIAKNWTLL